MKQLKTINTILLLNLSLMTAYGQEGLKFFNEGLVLNAKGEFQKAFEVFSKGIEINDISKSVNYYGRACANYGLKNLKQAKSDIKQSLKTEKINNERINSDIYWLQALVADTEGKKKLEIRSYKKAIEYAPDNDLLKISLGLALIEDNKHHKAIQILTEIIDKGNQHAFAYNNRGLAYLKLKDFEKAKSDFEESKNLDDQNPFLYKNYFLYYKEKNEMGNACKALEEALTKDMSMYGEEHDTKELKKLKAKFCP